MTSTSTSKYLFRLNALLMLVAAALLTGCESDQTTTVSDGFGMTFTESNNN
ncbi:hypothetical protein H5P28_02645 [Ruficoccus amylovorans]|uniref:Uncharacterized protein n=1 Tax=Ruficoccus amylovorans TaxID=1804625 RepID=A0A842HCM9_9BACT|nr:hypothetical protein [Ruficoccus amylovorans]MBC2593151.1 hypothetical protein [Ruficoccus amylovorans]